MPAVTLSGKNFSVNGVIINDPDRDLGNSEVVGDYEVSPILWEVRRERRIELVYEAFASMIFAVGENCIMRI